MNKAWIEKNKRAILGLGILAVLLVLNLFSYWNRLAKRQSGQAAPFSSSKEPAPVSNQPTLPAEKLDLSEMLLRLKSFPPIVRLNKTREPFIPPSRKLFQWETIFEVASEVIPLAASIPESISSYPAIQYSLRGSGEVGGRKTLFVQSNNQLFLLTENEKYSEIPVHVVSASGSTALLEDTEGNQTEISDSPKSDLKLGKAVEILLGKRQGSVYNLVVSSSTPGFNSPMVATISMAPIAPTSP